MTNQWTTWAEWHWLGHRVWIMVGNAAQDIEKWLVSLFGSFRVQPCASKNGWLVGLSRSWWSEPSVARDAVNGRLGPVRIGVWRSNSRTVSSWTNPYHHTICMWWYELGWPGHMGKVYKPLQGVKTKYLAVSPVICLILRLWHILTHTYFLITKTWWVNLMGCCESNGLQK